MDTIHHTHLALAVALAMTLLLVIALTAGTAPSHGDPFQHPPHAIPGF